MTEPVYNDANPVAKWEKAKSTFAHNMSLPVHSWFRFPAGFSASWVERLVRERKDMLDDLAFLDPFAGVGTAVLAAERAGVKAYGIEAQPFIAKIAQAKLLWHTNIYSFLDHAQAVLRSAKSFTVQDLLYPPLIQKCYTEDAIRQLYALRFAWEEMDDGSAPSRLTWLAIVNILRASSFVGTAPWQYVLPRKSKKKVASPYEAFLDQIHKMASDMAQLQAEGIRHDGEVLVGDARTCRGIGDSTIGLVITSPPYLNNFDYADATRLEMTFFGEVESWRDLHERARKHLIHSCSQHVSIEKPDIEQLFDDLADVPFSKELQAVYDQLAEERLKHGGKKNYHLMVAAYFADMKKVWSALRRVCVDGADVFFVVGDSAPYGVHVPVERWLGDLALLAGFKSYTFEKIRSRNVKWKNRKHRVPLQEGILWVKG
ncbi:MAG: DNA methyltransferase [Candidatus Hadarchaeum sp.]|uniref:DNA methyltransferase n=1 Tax=Candidatus Hadarchaeum sp. TaxID=2883567 RepID=UPI003D0A06C1